MKTSTAHARLEALQLAAEGCLSRKEALKILNKAEKAHQKLESSAAPCTAPSNRNHNLKSRTKNILTNRVKHLLTKDNFGTIYLKNT